MPKPESLLSHLAETPELIRSLVTNTSPAKLIHKPSDKHFSLLEHVCHLRDIEREGYSVRLKRILSEKHPTLPDIDGDRLARARDYNSESFAAALTGFTVARRTNVRSIESVEAGYLNRTGLLENVGIITVNELLSIVHQHDEEHLLAIRELVS